MPAMRLKAGLGRLAAASARWDSSLLSREVVSLLQLGLPIIPDYVHPAVIWTPWTREVKTEGMRVDVGGVRIPFKLRGDIVYGFSHTTNPLHGLRIGEASNPGPARDSHEAGGIYYGQFDGEFKLGIYIKRLGATSADFEYVFAVPTRPWLPGACEARAREGTFICDVRFVKIRGTNGFRRDPGLWTCTG